MGTADYMAPEQAGDARTADIRADIYSLGCTLYHLLAGRVPFPDGSTLDKMLRHSADPPTDLAQLRPGLPAGLAVVVRKMMAKAPAARFQTPAEVAAALAPFAAPRRSRRLMVAAAVSRSGSARWFGPVRLAGQTILVWSGAPPSVPAPPPAGPGPVVMVPPKAGKPPRPPLVRARPGKVPRRHPEGPRLSRQGAEGRRPLGGRQRPVSDGLDDAGRHGDAHGRQHRRRRRVRRLRPQGRGLADGVRAARRAAGRQNRLKPGPRIYDGPRLRHAVPGHRLRPGRRRRPPPQIGADPR